MAAAFVVDGDGAAAAGESAWGQLVRLIAHANDDRLRVELAADQSEYVVGRSAVCDVRIPGSWDGSAWVGKLQCRVVRRGARAYVVDDGSTNGTYLNGRRLKTGRRKRLAHGDELSLGVGAGTSGGDGGADQEQRQCRRRVDGTGTVGSR